MKLDMNDVALFLDLSWGVYHGMIIILR